MCRCTGWPDNPSFESLVAWCWEHGEDRAIVVVNLTGAPAQGRVHLPWSDLQENAWRLRDCLSDAAYVRDGVDLSQQGLYVASSPGSAIYSGATARPLPRGGLGRAHVTSPGLVVEPESRK